MPCFCNCMENMERFHVIKGHRIRHHERYHSFLYGLFYKRNINTFFPCLHTLYKHSWKFARTRSFVETFVLWARVPTSISRSPKLPLVFLFNNYIFCYYHVMSSSVHPITEQTTGKWNLFVK